jgi:hypothetical protein
MVDVFKVLDLPELPQEFETECRDAVYDRLGLDIIIQRAGFDFSKDSTTVKKLSRDDVIAYKKYVDTYQDSPKYVEWYDLSKRRICAIKRYPFSSSLMNYIEESIFKGISEVNEIQIGHQLWFGGEVIWPHTDGIRDCLLMYILDEGGTNVTTSWWKEKEKEINQSPDTHLFKFRNLDRYDSVRIPTGKWCLMNNTVIHSVENIVSDRISLTIGLRNFEVDLLIKELDIDFKYRG